MTTNPDDNRLLYPNTTTEDRDRILTDTSYVVSPSFVASTTWHARSFDDAKMLYNKTGTVPMRCSVVGLISPDHIYLDNHGDFNADDTYATFSGFRDASYSFSLVSPGSLHPDFDRDFRKTVANIRDICQFLNDDEVVEEPFISPIETGGVSLNFERKVFQHFSGYGSASFETVAPSSLDTYRVREDCQGFLNRIKFDYLARNVHVVDCKGVRVPPEMRAAFVKNKLAHVYFTLRAIPEAGLLAEFDTISLFSDDYTTWAKYM